MRKRIGSYNIQKNKDIGHGQSAAVYLARHIDSQEIVALKLFHVFAPEKRVQRTFLRETEIITRLNHPNIIRVLYVGFDENNPYYVMSYAPGGNLRSKVVLGSRLSPEEVDVYLQQIAAAIQHVHDNGLVHCDLKPENILIAADGTMLLADFGITRSIQTIQAQSTQGAAGTPLYMAPEQFLGRPDVASDQYSLGVLVYELLAGSPPFTGNNAVELMSPHLHNMPPSLTARNPAVSPRLEAVVFRALEKKPENRFPSVLDFAQAFHQAIYEPAGTIPIIFSEAVDEGTDIERIDEKIASNRKKISIGQRLRRERELRGWSQQWLAENLKVSSASVSNWERGVTLPGLRLRRRLMEIFGTIIEELFAELYSDVPAPSFEEDNHIPPDEHSSKIAKLEASKLHEEGLRLDNAASETRGSGSSLSEKEKIQGLPSYYSCLILYSQQERSFAEKLLEGLHERDVRCWLALVDVGDGNKILPATETAINSYDKIAFLFSETSADNYSIETGIEAAFRREVIEGREILIPICLGDLNDTLYLPWALALVQRSSTLRIVGVHESNIDEMVLAFILKKITHA